MQLKSIEIVGFKSFAEKTKIDFPDGMTGIVGPNGSGKSNIAESIRWVLGEQSAKTLRGSKMFDVIFSGSANRKSQSMAAVTLTLDNSDGYVKTPFSEIKVARKLFRNGDSAYFINEKECRLKDIVNMFMDSGIGQGSLSIISQGNVEAIFNSKPEDRRSIVENVAGVYKYKQQKLSAQHELDTTSENLDRVNDIIHELQQRMNPLEEQSSLAKDYLDQKKQLDALEKSKLMIDANRLETEIEGLKAKAKDLDDAKNNLTEQLRGQTQHKIDLQAQLESNNSEAEKLQNRLLELSKQIERLKSEQQLSSQKQNFNSENIKRISDQIEAAEAEKQSQSQKFEQLVVDQNDIKQQLLASQSKIDDLNAKLPNKSSDELDKEIQATRDKYVELLQSKTELKNRINLQTRDSQQLDEQLKSQSTRISDLSKQIDERQSAINKDKQALNELKVQLDERTEQLKVLGTSYQEVKEQTDQANQSWLAALRVAEEAKAKLQSLKNLHDSYRGFYFGVSNLLKHRDDFEGIYGTVSEFVKIDTEYIKAIDVAMGGQSQNVIVENNSVASKAIHFLTKNRLGRVTLLPLDTIKGRYIADATLNKVKQADGFIGVASDLIAVDNKFLQVIKFILGTTIVARDLDSAIKISAMISHRNRVVTLDGQVVNPGGSLTGGASKKTSQSVLVQQTELEELEKTVAQMNQKLESKEKELANLKAKNAKQLDQGNTLKNTQQSLKQKFDIKSELIEQSQEGLDHLTRQLKTLKLAYNNAIKGNVSDEANGLSDQLVEIENSLASAETKVADLTEELKNAKAAEASFRSEQQSLHEQQVVLQQRQKQINKEVSLVKDSLNESKNQIIEYTKQQAKLKSESANQVSKADLVKQLSQSQLEEQQANTDLEKLKAQIADSNQALASLNDDIAENQINLTNVNNEIKANSDINSQDTQRLEKLKADLLDKYGVEAQSIEDFNNQEINISELISRIKMLQRGIAEIGPVNVSAIQEFNDVSERYKFLNEQRDDLVAAENKLQRTMKSMDDTISTKFAESFAEISKNFSKVFVDMFGGGEAKLVLVDPDDMLNTGIEIMVQPPGKTYRNLSLLSGGEKALTAITLLFAVIKVRPVPFCILDEAEAALDPFNADRFAQYLKRYGSDTQFIVITHRKETMIYADQLYGVTMQESGVSKVVTVNLDNVQEEVQ